MIPLSGLPFSAAHRTTAPRHAVAPMGRSLRDEVRSLMGRISWITCARRGLPAGRVGHRRECTWAEASTPSWRRRRGQAVSSAQSVTALPSLINGARARGILPGLIAGIDNGFCIALLERTGERTFISTKGPEGRWHQSRLADFDAHDEPGDVLVDGSLGHPANRGGRGGSTARTAGVRVLLDVSP